MIRPLRLADVDEAVIALREYAQEMGYPYNEEHTRKKLTAWADNKMPILVVEKDGEIQGISAFIMTPHFYDPSIKDAREFIWHTKPSLPVILRAKIMRQLLDIMIRASEMVQTTLHIAVPAGEQGQGLSKLLERRGFILSELHYKKECR